MALEVLSMVFPIVAETAPEASRCPQGGTGALTLYQGAISDSTSVVSSGLVNLCADSYPLFLVDEENCTTRPRSSSRS